MDCNLERRVFGVRLFFFFDIDQGAIFVGMDHDVGRCFSSFFSCPSFDFGQILKMGLLESPSDARKMGP